MLTTKTVIIEQRQRRCFVFVPSDVISYFKSCNFVSSLRFFFCCIALHECDNVSLYSKRCVAMRFITLQNKMRNTNVERSTKAFFLSIHVSKNWKRRKIWNTTALTGIFIFHIEVSAKFDIHFISMFMFLRDKKLTRFTDNKSSSVLTDST